MLVLRWKKKQNIDVWNIMEDIFFPKWFILVLLDQHKSYMQFQTSKILQNYFIFFFNIIQFPSEHFVCFC